jgi:hypothetical protein
MIKAARCKRKRSFKHLFLLLLFFFPIKANSQELWTKELIWTKNDSIKETDLNDTSQIISRVTKGNKYQYASYESFDIKIKEYAIFILIEDPCSGIYCPIINVFKEENGHWKLLAWAHANLAGRIKIEVDTLQEKLIFTTKSGKIGELIVGTEKE